MKSPRLKSYIQVGRLKLDLELFWIILKFKRARVALVATSETSDTEWTEAIYQASWPDTQLPAPTPAHPGCSSGELIINYLIMYLCCQNNCELWFFFLRSNDKVTEHTRVQRDGQGERSLMILSLYQSVGLCSECLSLRGVRKSSDNKS